MVRVRRMKVLEILKNRRREKGKERVKERGKERGKKRLVKDKRKNHRQKRIWKQKMPRKLMIAPQSVRPLGKILQIQVEKNQGQIMEPKAREPEQRKRKPRRIIKTMTKRIRMQKLRTKRPGCKEFLYVQYHLKQLIIDPAAIGTCPGSCEESSQKGSVLDGSRRSAGEVLSWVRMHFISCNRFVLRVWSHNTPQKYSKYGWLNPIISCFIGVCSFENMKTGIPGIKSGLGLWEMKLVVPPLESCWGLEWCPFLLGK